MADSGLASQPRKAGAVFRPQAVDGFSALLRRLGRLRVLTAAEVDQVRALAVTRRRWRSGSLLVADGRAMGPHFVLAGWACSQRILRDGRRQIFDFILPGESFGFTWDVEDRGRQTIVALTAVETVDASMLREIPREASNGIWQAIRAMRLEADARRLDQMVRLGRLNGYEKAAHFIQDVQDRTGATDARSFPLPLTQETIADALGLSIVHLNRVLRQLKAAKVAEIRNGVALVHDPRALAAAAVLPPPLNHLALTL